MKRCNNCGWFNLDSATHCEKCSEESFEHGVECLQELAENATVEEMANVEQKAEVLSESRVGLESIDEEKSFEIDATSSQETVIATENSFANATVSFGENMSGQLKEGVAKKENIKNLAATAKFAKEMLDDIAASVSSKKSCPKCRYPISGRMEYCPNCGATIRANLRATTRTIAFESIVSETVCEQAQDTDYKAKKTEELGSTVFITEQKSDNLKATVRDVPDRLMYDNENCFRLVPVNAVGEAIIELVLGEEVVIAGYRYKFQK